MDECSKGCFCLSFGVVSAHTSSPHVARGLPNVHSTESSPVLCVLHFFFSHLRSDHDSLLPEERGTVHARNSQLQLRPCMHAIPYFEPASWLIGYLNLKRGS